MLYCLYMKISTIQSNTKKKPLAWTRKGRCPSCNVKKGVRHNKTCQLEYVFDGLPGERNDKIINDVIDTCGYDKVAEKYSITRQRVYQIFKKKYPDKSPIQVALEQVKQLRK